MDYRLYEIVVYLGNRETVSHSKLLSDLSDLGALEKLEESIGWLLKGKIVSVRGKETKTYSLRKKGRELFQGSFEFFADLYSELVPPF